jgi:hypothetical protein
MPTSPMRFRCHGLAETYAASEALLPGRRLQIECSKGEVCRSEVEVSDIAGLRVLCMKNTLPIAFTATEMDDWLTLSFVERGGQIVERRGGEIRESVPGRCATGAAVRPGDVVKVGANCERRIIYVPPRHLNDVIARHFHVAPPRMVELLPAVVAGAPHDALYQLTRRAVVGAETTADGAFGSIVAIFRFADILHSPGHSQHIF